jgi:hypothetical protein
MMRAYSKLPSARIEHYNDQCRALAAAAVGIAYGAAYNYLVKNTLCAQSEQALAECVKSWVKAKIGEAIEDAKEAIDSGMEHWAFASFSASMVLAGIEAAKEASHE